MKRDNKASEFAERVANIHINHSKIQRIYNVLTSMRCLGKVGQGKNSPVGLFIVGQSGVGKTRMIKKYTDLNPGYTKIIDDIEYDIKPVVYLELPDPFTILELYQTIIRALGAPERLGRPTIGEVKRQVFTLLQKQEVEMLILDEMDYILSSKYVKNQEAMEAIKHISNVAKISLVCLGTPPVDSLRKINFQYFRRFTKIQFERFSELDGEFCLFLKNIEEQIKPFELIGLGDLDTGLPQIFYDMSKGLVSIITATIQEAYRLVGVFNKDFNDVSKSKLDLDLLYTAYKNIVGDMTETDFQKAIDLR